MKVNFNVKDRLTIINILPSTGTILEITNSMDIVKIIRFTEDEKNLLNYSEQDSKIYWDTSKEVNKEYNLTTEQIMLLKECVKKLDDIKHVDMNSIETCLKINSL